MSQKVGPMRFAMIAPDQDRRSLAAIRSELDLFNVELVAIPAPRWRATGESVDLFDELVDDLCEQLALRGPWDGVLLAPPGGGRQSHDNSAITARVRRLLGSNVPVGIVDKTRVDAPQQLLSSLTTLWMLRTIASDRTARPTSGYDCTVERR